jgi:hypothetical protein
MNYITKKITFFIALLFIASFENQATATLLNSVQTTPGKAYLWNVMYQSDDDSDYVELEEVEHYSQSPEFKLPKVTGKVKRAEFNQKIILLHLGSLGDDIIRFQGTPNARNLKFLLDEIANIANQAYNATRRGHLIGTYKHKLCKDFMVEIKSQYSGFSKVHPEYPLDDARFDVIWFDSTDAYVFDYKFGEDTNKSSSQDNIKYSKALSSSGYTMKGNIRDINPSK